MSDPSAHPVAAFPPASGLQLRALTTVLVLGLLIGGLLGCLIGAFSGQQPSATALIRLTPLGNPALGVLNGDQQAQTDTEDYVASELVYLSSPTMLRGMQERLGLTEAPDFTASQNSTSPLVTLSASAGSHEEAIGVVAAAIDVYTGRQREQAEQRTAAALTAIDETVRELNARDDAPAALLTRLQNLRADIQLRSAEGTGFEVVEAPVVAPPSGKPWALGALLGAALGGLVAVGGLMLHRQLSRRIHDEQDLAGVVDQVLHPKVDRRITWTTVLPEDDHRRQLARLLLTQLGPAPQDNTRVIVVVGASTASGSSVVASLLAIATAEREPTQLARSAEELTTVLAELGGADSVVVDAGPVMSSPAFLDVVTRATDIVLVACLGLDRPVEAAAVATAARSSDVPVSAVLTTSSLRERWDALRLSQTIKVEFPVRRSASDDNCTETAASRTESEAAADVESGSSVPGRS
jgi:hypothetical protein